MLFLLVLQHQLIDLKYNEYNYTSSRSVCKLSTSTFVSSTFFFLPLPISGTNIWSVQQEVWDKRKECRNKKQHPLWHHNGEAQISRSFFNDWLQPWEPRGTFLRGYEESRCNFSTVLDASHFLHHSLQQC